MIDPNPIMPLAQEDILALPAHERIPYVEQIRINYPRRDTILKQIEYCHKKQSYAAEPPCLLVIGPTGVGKTQLINSYTRNFPRTRTSSSLHTPVLSGRIPSPATISTLLTELLNGLGDPRADRGTIGGKTVRLRNLIRDCQVQLFILDEIQHFYDLDSQKILLNVSNWLKALIKDTGVACILVGLKGHAEQIVNTNPQLARLFGDPLVLSTFDWNYKKPDTILEFRQFLHQLETILPLREATKSNLSSTDRALRCFIASEGLMAHIMDLVRSATEQALLQGQEYLDDHLLSQAFLQFLAPERRKISNPFVGDIPTVFVNNTSSPSLPESNKRGKRRKGRTPKTSDIVRS